jgi:hypothetical protein
MVSRNAGWSMTDLKGEPVSCLLSSEEQKNLFLLLERGNWLIFQDAYPQLLLYEESKKQMRNLFYLLPYFNVSTFMETVWHHFLTFRSKEILSYALIVNEQNYIEQRVIQVPYFKQTVFDSIEFQLQELFSLSHILFPLYRNDSKIPSLIGKTVNHFASLEERIMLGKQLYHMLFIEENLKDVFRWAKGCSHTGSRKDYWPHLFSTLKKSNPNESYMSRVSNCQLKKGKKQLYSPSLTDAWKNVHHEKAEVEDWFEDWKVIHYLSMEKQLGQSNITENYCYTLEKLELAVIAKQSFFN